MNLVTSVFTAKNGWHIIPTFTALSTGTDMDGKVLGTVDTADVYVHLLPEALHEVCLEETLVVGKYSTYWWVTAR